MTSDRERWDARYRGRPAELAPPDPVVVDWVPRLALPPRAPVLDLAAGMGRHAVWLASRGLACEAWDVSPVGLELLLHAGNSRGVEVETREVDLTLDRFPEGKLGRFRLVVVVDFLDRALLSRLWELLAPGGHALVSTFTEEYPGEHPSRRFRLARGELAGGLMGLETVDLHEHGGRAALLGRRPSGPLAER